MNRVAVLFLAMMFTLGGLAYAAPRTKTDSVMVNHPKAKIRSGPATTYTVLWRPRMYTPLEVLSKFIDEKGMVWYCVRDVAGDIGWIHHSTVTDQGAAIVTSGNVTVRDKPSNDGTAKYQVPKLFTFKVLSAKKGWLQVEDPEGDKGWITGKDVWRGHTPKPKDGPKKF